MKLTLFLVLTFAISFQSNSQDFFRNEILKKYHQDQYESIHETVNENLELIIKNHLLDYRELFLIYLNNDSLILNMDLMYTMRTWYRDSLNSYLFSKALSEYDLLQLKINQLSKSEAEREFYLLFVDHILFPGGDQDLNEADFKRRNQSVRNRYVDKISDCPDTLYYSMASLLLRRRTLSSMLSGVYYKFGYFPGENLFDEDGHRIGYNEFAPILGLGHNLLLNKGVFAFEYGYKLDLIHKWSWDYNHNSENDSYKLGYDFNVGMGFTFLNNDRYNLSLLFFVNPFVFDRNNAVLIWGGKTDLILKSRNIHSTKNTLYKYTEKKNTTSISLGVGFSETKDFLLSFGVLFGHEKETINKKITPHYKIRKLLN